MKKICGILILLVIFSGTNYFFAYSRDEFLNLQIPSRLVRGKISDISRVNSQISITYSPEKDKVETIKLAITEKTTFTKNKVYVSFTELMIGDEVIVEYYENPKIEGPLIANNIEVIKR